jgi:DNA-binding IclR family transcriptional regulator
MDQATIRKLARTHNAGIDAQSPQYLPQVLEQAATDRANGYAMSLNHVTPRAGSIAMALLTCPL